MKIKILTPIIISLGFLSIFYSCKKDKIKEMDYFSDKYKQESEGIAAKISDGINIVLNNNFSKKEIFNEIIANNGIDKLDSRELDLFTEKMNDANNIDNYLKYKNYNAYETDKIFNLFRFIDNSLSNSIKENLQIFLKNIDENQISNKDSFYKDVNYMYYTILAVTESLDKYKSVNDINPKWDWSDFWRETVKGATC